MPALFCNGEYIRGQNHNHPSMLPIPAPASLDSLLESGLFPCEQEAQRQHKAARSCGMIHTYPQQEGYETVQIVKLPCATAQEQKRRVYPSYKPQQSPDQTTVDVTFRMGDAC